MHTLLNVSGMDCADEVAAVERALRPIAGVKNVSVNLVVGTVAVEHEGNVAPEALVKAIGNVGLKAQVGGERNKTDEHTGGRTGEDVEDEDDVDVDVEDDDARTAGEKRRLFEAQRGRLISTVASGALTGIGLLIELVWPSLASGLRVLRWHFSLHFLNCSSHIVYLERGVPFGHCST